MRLIALILILSFPVQALAATEKLDEVMARKARKAAATWGNSLLESGSYVWQPETLAYKDETTDNEVWRLSNTPSKYNAFHSDIGMSPWSANGKRLAFKSDRDTAAFTRGSYKVWLTVNADGSLLRTMPDAPARVDYHTLYFHWSPLLPDVYFEMGKTAAGNTGVTPNVLYKATVGDSSVSKSAWVTLPATKGTDLKLFKTVSADGKKAIVCTNDQTWLFPLTVYGTPGLDVAGGYSSNRSFGGTWGDTPTSYTSYHDAYYPGDGSWLYLMPSGSHAWWKNKVLGSAADGGSLYSFTAPNIFGEQVPVNTTIGGTPDPFGSHYWSHIVPDRWGRYALFSDGDVIPIGPAVWDVTNASTLVASFGGGAEHNDWEAWSDFNISTKGPTSSDFSADRLYVQKYNDSASQKTIAYTHDLYNNGGVYAGASYEYDAIPRPAQSPDGTKIAFHSTFLNNKGASYDNLPDVFWTVAYYPYPPEIRSAVKSGANVRLTWDFNQGTAASPNHSNPRTYTVRGWPNETADLPPSPREVDKFRVWVSTDNSAWSPLGTTTYNNCRGSNECGAWTETAWTYDAAQPISSTRYYAVTSVEYSRLESRILSNTWKVTTDGSGNVTASAQQTAYPTNPGGKATFYTAKPAAISYSAAATGTAGHYRVNWSEPADTSMVRYYNIYAKDGSAPTAVQQTRIASVPVGTATYLDWLGNTDGTTQYLVTAVDYQGNESAGTASAPTRTALSGKLSGKIR